jgi:hypothetical protein
MRNSASPDRNLVECEAISWNASCKCPGPVSPLALSLGYVTAARNAGQPKDVTGERVNMSEKALVKGYRVESSAQNADNIKIVLCLPMVEASIDCLTIFVSFPQTQH